MHPTRYIIDLAALRNNARVIRGVVGPRPALMAVVKANAYGHGALRAAQTVLSAGATWCGVATLPEAIALRDGGIQAPILIMGYTPPRFASEAIKQHIRLCVYDLAVARGYAEAAAALGKRCHVHIKLDSGMGRLGVLPGAAAAFIDTLQAMHALDVEAVYTHFSCSDSDADYTRAQLAQFERATAHTGLMRHACNSGGVFGFPEAHFDMVRPGVALYGMSPYAPEPAPHPSFQALKPVLRMVTEVASVKTLPDGASVGYNRRYRCAGERTIAVIPIGYGDGFRRTPRNYGDVLVHGKRAPILGTVCMDQTMIDVSHIPGVAIGAEVVVLGAQGDARITADEAAANMGTINYEVTTALLGRPEREYTEDYE
jgi:alanine racemase